MADLRQVTVARTLRQVIIDVSLTLVAMYLASWIRYLLPWGVPVVWRVVAVPWQVYVAVALIWPTIFSWMSVYEPRAHAWRRLRVELQTLIAGLFVALSVLAGVLYFSFRWLPRRLFLYFGLVDLLFLTLARVIPAFRRRKHCSELRLLIVGAGRVGSEIARQIREHRTGWEIVGFLDDDPSKTGLWIEGAPVLGTLDQLERIIAHHSVSEVIFALPLRAHERLVQMVLDLERLPVEVSVVPDYFDLAFFRVRMDEFLGFPLIRLRASAIEGWARVAKRLFDLTGAIIGLLLCAPLFPIIALMIRLDSHGPVLFKQVRVGENGRLFKMWKFRTMVENAEELAPLVMTVTEDGCLLHKQRDDPRVTRVGRFLRRYSLDELPQLINVLRGEMSLVGPRPELPWMVERYEGWQRKRFVVPPGMTGWWQISGRSDRPLHLHVEDDLFYIQNYSLWLDLRILLRTIVVVLSGRGAF